MADFDVRPTQGVEVVDWLDESTSEVVTRLNPEGGFPHMNYQGKVGYGIVCKATVGGVEGEIDSNLGGRLFECWFAEAPLGASETITQASGISSVASFVPNKRGNYLLVFYRPEGGSVAIPIEVVSP